MKPRSRTTKVDARRSTLLRVALVLLAYAILFYFVLTRLTAAHLGSWAG